MTIDLQESDANTKKTERILTKKKGLCHDKPFNEFQQKFD